MRSLLLVLIAALVLAPAASAAERAVDRGIVVRVRPYVLVLRELDGTRAFLRVDGATAVMLDGHPASLHDLQRGDVAIVFHRGRRPAVLVRAFSR